MKNRDDEIAEFNKEQELMTKEINDKLPELKKMKPDFFYLTDDETDMISHLHNKKFTVQLAVDRLIEQISKLENQIFEYIRDCYPELLDKDFTIFWESPIKIGKIKELTDYEKRTMDGYRKFLKRMDK